MATTPPRSGVAPLQVQAGAFCERLDGEEGSSGDVHGACLNINKVPNLLDKEGSERLEQAVEKAFEGKNHHLELLDSRTGELITFDNRISRINRMRKRVFAFAEIAKKVLESDQSLGLFFETLTYETGKSWKPKDITRYIKLRKTDREIFGYVWVAEMQKRGEVHYHILWIGKKADWWSFADKAGLWLNGSTNLKRHKDMKAGAFYICQYVKKEHQKLGYPKGLRSHGSWWKKETLTKWERFLYRLSTLPKWLSEAVKSEIDVKGQVPEFPKRREGGGWIFKGEDYKSPFIVRKLSRKVYQKT